MAIKTVTDASFSTDVVEADDIVLVDFWATWCGPCRQIAPILDEIASEKEGSLTVAKVDIEENPSTPGQYGIRSVPTLLLFKGGEPIARKLGADSKENIAAWIDEAVSAAA